MIKIEMKTDNYGKFVVELKTLLDVIEYYQAKIDNVTEYIKLHIRKDDENPDYMEMFKYEYRELLEILDKGE